MTGKALVQQYLRSRTQSAWHKVGKVDVNIEGQMRGGLPLVRVNWPGIGAQKAEDALQFAADLTAACLVAVQAEALIVDWDVDQWLEPGLREEAEYEQAVRDL